MQWSEQVPLFSASCLPCSPQEPLPSYSGKAPNAPERQHPTSGAPGFGSIAMETFMGSRLKCPLGEWSRIHPRVSPCLCESLWDLTLMVAVLVWGATGAEQGISLPKAWGTAELILRVRFSAQEPVEQTYVILACWQKGDIESSEPVERYSSRTAFHLSWPSRSTGEHSNLLCILTFITGGQVQRT